MFRENLNKVRENSEIGSFMKNRLYIQNKEYTTETFKNIWEKKRPNSDLTTPVPTENFSTFEKEPEDWRTKENNTEKSSH